MTVYAKNDKIDSILRYLGAILYIAEKGFRTFYYVLHSSSFFVYNVCYGYSPRILFEIHDFNQHTISAVPQYNTNRMHLPAVSKPVIFSLRY